MKELKIELEARERCATELPKKRELTRSEPYTTEGLVFISTLACPCCGGKHFPNKCNIVTNVATRKRLLQVRKSCFICTREGHVSRDCKSKRTCYRCKGMHHTSICDRSREVRSESIRLRDRDKGHEIEGGNSKKDKGKEQSNGKDITTASTIIFGDKILLQTAKVRLKKSFSEGGVTCKLLLDSGSQRTYVTKRICDIIKANKKEKCRLSTGTFGGACSEMRTHDIVEVTVKGKVAPAEMVTNAVVVDSIYRPIQNQMVRSCKQLYKHLQPLMLADYSKDNKNVEIDILAGIDYYWNVVTGSVIRGREGPIAIHTIFGYALSGPLNNENRNHLQASTNTNMVTCTSSKTTENMLEPHHKGEDELSTMVEKFLKLESLGIETEKTQQTRTEAPIRFTGEKYEVELPW